MATVFYRGFYREIENLRLQCAWSGEVTGKNSNISSHCSAMFLCRTSPVVDVEHMYRQTVSKTTKTDDFYQAGLHKWQLTTLNKRSKPIIYCTNRWWHSSCISMVPLFSGSSVEENVFFSFAAGLRQFSQWKVSRKTEKNFNGEPIV